jgi:hypothetical protein
MGLGGPVLAGPRSLRSLGPVEIAAHEGLERPVGNHGGGSRARTMHHPRQDACHGARPPIIQRRSAAARAHLWARAQPKLRQCGPFDGGHAPDAGIPLRVSRPKPGAHRVGSRPNAASISVTGRRAEILGGARGPTALDPQRHRAPRQHPPRRPESSDAATRSARNTLPRVPNAAQDPRRRDSRAPESLIPNGALETPAL